jgi:hypothetical protein
MATQRLFQRRRRDCVVAVDALTWTQNLISETDELILCVPRGAPEFLPPRPFLVRERRFRAREFQS